MIPTLAPFQCYDFNMAKKDKQPKAKKHPILNFFKTEAHCFRAYFINSRFILFPATILGIGIIAFFALRFAGIYISQTDFANQANAMLEESGEAERVAYPTFQSVFYETFQGFKISADLTTMITSTGITDKALTDALKGQISDSVSAHNVFAIIGFGILFIAYLLSSVICGKKIKEANHVASGLKYTILNWVLKILVFGGLLIGLGYLFGLLPWASAIVSFILIPLFQALFSLWRAFLVQRGLKKTFGMFHVITFRDVIIFLLLTWGIYFIFGSFAVVLVSLFPDHAILTLVLALPLYVYTACFLEVYAQVYILEKGKAKNIPSYEK